MRLDETTLHATGVYLSSYGNPGGCMYYWKAHFVDEIIDPAINIHLKHGSAIPNMFSAMHLYPINGPAQRVGKTDTAWSYRDTTWAQVIVGVDPDPANTAKIVNWTRDYWTELCPYSAAGAYVNFMMDEGEDRVRATYRENYDRLSTIKTTYDPDNFFRVNQNIKPGNQRRNADLT